MHARMVKRGALLTVCAASLFRAKADVLLLNGGVADGVGNSPAEWTVNDIQKAGRSEWGSHDGDGWLMALFGWNGAVSTYGEIYQDVTNVVPGMVYTLSFWQDGDGNWNGSDVTARLIWLDAASAPIGSVTKNQDAYTNLSWSFHTLSGRAPGGAVAVRVQFDAVTLAEGGSGAAKFDELAFIEQAMGLYNPGFALGVDMDAHGWHEVPSTEGARRESWGSHDGDGYLMALPGYTAATYGAFYQDVPDVRPNERYTLSFWQEGDGGWNGSNVTARLIWLDGASAPIGSVTKPLDEWTFGGVTWTNHVISGMAPAGVSTLRVQFDAESPVGGGGAAKIDDLLLTRIVRMGTLLSVY